MRVFTGNPDARIEVNSTGYPESDPRFVSNSVVSNGGAFWFYCPPMFTFMILVDQIVSEKEKRLRLGMRTMGLKVRCLTWRARVWGGGGVAGGGGFSAP